MFYQSALNILFKQIIWFTDIKVCLYAGHMTLNRKDEKKCVEI